MDMVTFFFEDASTPDALDNGFYARFRNLASREPVEMHSSAALPHAQFSLAPQEWVNRSTPKKQPIVNSVYRDTDSATDDNTEMQSEGFQDQLCIALFRQSHQTSPFATLAVLFQCQPRSPQPEMRGRKQSAWQPSIPRL